MGEIKPSLGSEEWRSVALKKLAVRAERAKKEKKVNNAYLYAGSPMYYYCRICGVQTDVLPESHVERPKRYCDDCEELRAAGFSVAKNRFVAWKDVKCGACHGKCEIYIYRRKCWETCEECRGRGSVKVESED